MNQYGGINMSIIVKLINTGYAPSALAALFLVFLIASAPENAAAEDQKLTTLKEFSVDYKLEGNVEGKKSHHSQNYGRLYCLVEESEMTIQGAPTQKKNEKTIIYVEDGQQWIVTINKDDNTGTKMKNPMFEGMTAGMKGKTPEEFSTGFMKQMGGKEIGEKTVNGEKCMQWELMGGARTCITPDLISVENSVTMGPVSMTETAVKIMRNNPGPDGVCDIGDAKIKEIDMSQMMGQ